MAPNLVIYTWVAALALILVVYRRVRRFSAFHANRQQTGCFRAPKYPHTDPFFGCDLYKERQQALRAGNVQALYTRDFNRLGKTWVENFLGQCVINTMDAVNHQHIHNLGFEDFGKPPTRAKISAPILGNGIFMAEGAHWRQSRGIIKPIFSRAEVGNMAMMARHVDRLLALLPRDSRTFDIQPMLKKLFLDLSTEFLFGESTNAQTLEGAPMAEEFLQSLDESLVGWNKRRQAGILSFRYIFDKTWPKAYSRLYSFIDAHVHRALDFTSRSTETEKVQAPTPTDRRYVLLYELAKQIRDPVALRFELINVFLPSRDTTAALLSNVFFQLARHPSYWTQLRESALSLPYDPSDPCFPSLSALTSLLTFRHVIQETLRTLGPAGRVFRTARRDTTLPRGGGSDGKSPVFVPRGSLVCSLTYHIHHDQDIWGEDVNDFRPERWTQGNQAGSGFVPFLSGPRICPAQQQVYVQATYLLFRIVMEFEWLENRDEVVQYVELQRMAIESRRGVRIALLPQVGGDEQKRSSE